MRAAVAVSLVLTAAAATVCVSPSEAQNCRNPPAWLFLYAEDIRVIFGAIENSIPLIEDGQVMSVLRSSEAVLGNFFIFESLDEIPVVWCIQSNEFEEIRYSLLLESRNATITANPTTTIAPQGTITDRPYRFRIRFRCFPTGSPQSVIITVSFNSSSPSGENFCPLQFFFVKRCDSTGSNLLPDELPTMFEAIGITDGYINDTDISVKTTQHIATQIITPAGEGVVPMVLKGVLIPLCTIILIISVIAVVVWVMWYRRSRKKLLMEFSAEAVGLAYQQLYISSLKKGHHEKEFPLQKLKIVRSLGEGAFGIVSQAEAEGIIEGEPFTDVAVKQLRQGSNEVDDFFREVDFMSGLSHPNIVTLLGVCSAEEPYSMIFEFMDLGDLRSFLREAVGLGEDMEMYDENQQEDEGDTTDELLSNEELLSITLQVSQGMEYISSKHLVHRDLASRNCLVSTGLVIKIADFGMSRNIDTSDYYRVKGSALLPIRWMPPESILYGKFTTESDIWAFGILLWEIFTFGQQPYYGIADEEVIMMIKEGKHPEPPPDRPANQLMLQCWNHTPKKRPPFEECSKEIQQLLSR